MQGQYYYLSKKLHVYYQKYYPFAISHDKLQVLVYENHYVTANCQY